MRLFGVAIAAAILSKYNNVIFLGALIASTLSLRETRGVILQPPVSDQRGRGGAAVPADALLEPDRTPTELLSHSGGFGMGKGESAIHTAFDGHTRMWARRSSTFAVLPVGIFAVALLVAWNKPAPAPRPAPWTAKLVWRTIAFALA